MWTEYNKIKQNTLKYRPDYTEISTKLHRNTDRTTPKYRPSTDGPTDLHVLLDPSVRFFRLLLSLPEQLVDAFIRQALAVVHAKNLVRAELNHGHELALLHTQKKEQRPIS